MKVKIDGTEVETTDYPTVTIGHQEADERSGLGGGPTVATIRAVGPNGKVGLFWVSVKFKKGRPVVRLTSEPTHGKEVSKDVTGTCRID